MCVIILVEVIIIKKSDFINEINNIKLIAHRLGYQMTPYPENSLEVLKYIFDRKELLDACYGFEFDICFTKDHVPVVIHDKYIDDISDNFGLVKDYTIDELASLVFKFRKSLKKDSDITSFKIVTLEEMLSFFNDNLSLLQDKLIKIETKNFVFASKHNFSTKNLEILADIVSKYPDLSQNIVHLSFWPLNLLFFRKIQKKNNQELVKNDLLCDYSFIVMLTRLMPFLDNISLRIKTHSGAEIDDNNSKRVNKKIFWDEFWINFANALKDKNIRYALEKFGTVGLYTLDCEEEIDELCKNIDENTFKTNAENIVITTNSPIYVRKLK